MGKSLESKLLPNELRVIEYLSQHDFLDARTDQIGITTEELARTVRKLTLHEPPIINQLGSSSMYQLSNYGRKFWRVPEADTTYRPPAPSIFHKPRHTKEIGPGPRGVLVAELKKRRCSVHELCARTALKPYQVTYFLKTLADRGLLARWPCSTDGRIILYSLKEQLMEREPAKPVLTPSLVPLTDPTDWRTWFERLAIEQAGGPPAVEKEHEHTHTALTPTRTGLQKILVIGSKPEMRPYLLGEFSGKLDIHFYDDPRGASGLQARCRQVDRVFLCTERCRHSHLYAIREAETPITFVCGSYTKLRNVLKEYADGATV